MRPEYENVVTALLGCISVGWFLLLLQLLVPVISSFSMVFLGLYGVVSMLFATRSAYHERSRDGFDLTTPTVFENGLLVLRSRGDKCAVFFAFSLNLKDIHRERARRTLTTLLKVLPDSSVLSTEVTKQKECFVSLYIKLEKSDLLQRTRQLIESVLSGLKAVFGEDDVRLLRDDELLRHLTLGMPGRVQRVSRFSRHTAFLRTDASKCWLSAVAVANIQADFLQDFEVKSNYGSETSRVIYAVKNEQQRRVTLSSKLILSVATDGRHSDGSVFASSSTASRRILSSEIIRKLGDIMTRNVFGDETSQASFEKGAEELLSFTALWSTRRSDTESESSTSKVAHESSVNQRQWREALFATTEELGLVYEADILVWTKGFPFRVDARVGSTLCRVVPNSGGERARLQWLADELALAMASEPASCPVLLLGSPSDASAITELLMKTSPRKQIRCLTSIVQLQAVLLECRSTPATAADSPAEAVQKIL